MRKKIPLIGGIINLIESLKGDIGIIENTDVATHSISAGSYVIWHNELYKASSAIAVDDALSSSNLTAVSGGAANELNNNFNPASIQLADTTGSIVVYSSVNRTSGTGIVFDIAGFTKRPTSITPNNFQIYDADTWKNLTIGEWFVSGITLYIAINMTNISSVTVGPHGVRGSLSFTY